MTQSVAAVDSQSSLAQLRHAPSKRVASSGEAARQSCRVAKHVALASSGVASKSATSRVSQTLEQHQLLGVDSTSKRRHDLVAARLSVQTGRAGAQALRQLGVNALHSIHLAGQGANSLSVTLNARSVRVAQCQLATQHNQALTSLCVLKVAQRAAHGANAEAQKLNVTLLRAAVQACRELVEALTVQSDKAATSTATALLIGSATRQTGSQSTTLAQEPFRAQVVDTSALVGATTTRTARSATPRVTAAATGV